MHFKALLRMLKARRAGIDRWTAHCPNHDDRSPSLSVRLTSAHKLLVHCHAGCEQNAVIKRLREEGVWPSSSDELRPEVAAGVAAPTANRSFSEFGLKLWREARTPAGTPVETYLTNRCIWVPLVGSGGAIRFHPATPMGLSGGGSDRFPAMLALMRNIRTNEPSGIQRTALRADGAGKTNDVRLKQPRQMLGPAGGAAVKLSPDEDVTLGLAIAEGVETALSLAAINCVPVWACMSAPGMASFPILAGLEALTVYADHDSSGAGQRAAAACARRYRDAGVDCRALMPRDIGSDWNDFHRGRL